MEAFDENAPRAHPAQLRAGCPARDCRLRFLYLPIVTLIVYSFNGSGEVDFLRGLTLNWYRLLFADDANLDLGPEQPAGAFAAMAISLIFGIPAALALVAANFPGRCCSAGWCCCSLSARNHHRTFSVNAFAPSSEAQPPDHRSGPRHGADFGATTEVFAGLQKLDRAQKESILDLGQLLADFWRVTHPQLRLFDHRRGAADFPPYHGRIAVSFFLIGRNNICRSKLGRLRRGITPEINAISSIIFVFPGCDL